MKFTRNDFLQTSDCSIQLDQPVPVPDTSVFANTLVSSLREGTVKGKLVFDGRSRVQCFLHVEGVMNVLDSFTSEEIPVDFEADLEPVYSFDPDSDEEVHQALRGVIDLAPAVYEAIAFEAPMSITTLSRQDYPSGSGWSVSSDQDEPDQTDEIDPRWKKLSEFKLEDE